MVAMNGPYRFDLNQASSLITNLIIENKIDINQFQEKKHNI